MANAIITVRRPELTEEERTHRMEGIKQAAARLIIATAKNRKESIHNERNQNDR